jgi:hypothetical protein
MKRVRLTPALTRRIVKDVRLGVPSEVAARKVGVSLDTFADWMTKKGRKYAALQRAVDQAEAAAVADKVVAINKAIKRGKASAARWWLERRATTYFPSSKGRGDVTIGALTILQQLKAEIAARPEPEDPRQVILREERERRELQSQPPTPSSRVSYKSHSPSRLWRMSSGRGRM